MNLETRFRALRSKVAGTHEIGEKDGFVHDVGPTKEERAGVILANIWHQLLYNVFSYGCKTGYVSKNAEETIIINVGNDNQGSFAPQFDIKSGSVTAINSLRHNGYSYELESGDVAFYNRTAMGEVGEKTLIKSK